jgi:hypothetical protein
MERGPELVAGAILNSLRMRFTRRPTKLVAINLHIRIIECKRKKLPQVRKKWQKITK